MSTERTRTLRAKSGHCATARGQIKRLVHAILPGSAANAPSASHCAAQTRAATAFIVRRNTGAHHDDVGGHSLSRAGALSQTLVCVQREMLLSLLTFMDSPHPRKSRTVLMHAAGHHVFRLVRRG